LFPSARTLVFDFASWPERRLLPGATFELGIEAEVWALAVGVYRTQRHQRARGR